MPATRHKALSLYPQWCVDVMLKFCSGSKYEQVRIPGDRKTAHSSSHTFYRARMAFCREVKDGNQVEIVLDIICRITNLGHPGKSGEYMLEFIPRGLAILADETRGSKRGLESPLRQEERRVEQELDGLDQILCTHEWDTTGTLCLKCKLQLGQGPKAGPGPQPQ